MWENWTFWLLIVKCIQCLSDIKIMRVSHEKGIIFNYILHHQFYVIKWNIGESAGTFIQREIIVHWWNEQGRIIFVKILNWQVMIKENPRCLKLPYTIQKELSRFVKENTDFKKYEIKFKTEGTYSRVAHSKNIYVSFPSKLVPHRISGASPFLSK